MGVSEKFLSYYNNKNVVLHELIGLNVKVLKSKDKDQKGLEGTVIDETKNTLIVKTKNGIKNLVKIMSVFRFSIDGKRFIVDGAEINFRPYERIEKGLKFYKRRKVK